jgi:Fe-S cluster biogenesis protein NfuA|eukprot:Stramenopile-MAST_4_protein_3090
MIRPFLFRYYSTGLRSATERGKLSYPQHFRRRAKLHVYATATPNPHAYKFECLEDDGKLRLYLERGMGIKSPRQFSTPSRARRFSELAEVVLLQNGVDNVFLGDSFLTVQKEKDSDWDDLCKGVEAAIMSFVEGYVVDEEHATAAEVMVNRENSAYFMDHLKHADQVLAAEVEEVIHEKARPHILADGGDVEFVMIDKNGVVHLRMLGACVSCASSTITVRFMIKNMLMHYFPDEVTDCVHVDWDEEED